MVLISTGLCFFGTSAKVKWNLIVSSRSPQSIVEDIHHGKSEHYGSETLREFLKLLPDSEEVRNLAHEFNVFRSFKTHMKVGSLLPRATVFSPISKK